MSGLDKKTKLFNEGFKLFKTKGTSNTSISEITQNAGVAKGTFYLYFKDKYDLQEQLIVRKSNELFTKALNKCEKENLDTFSDKLIFIINDIIDALTHNKLLLKFISKNLSFGLYSERIPEIINNKDLSLRDLFIKGLREDSINIKNPDITLFMIIELVSSTCLSTIVNSNPISIEEYKPYLYEIIKKMIKNN